MSDRSLMPNILYVQISVEYEFVCIGTATQTSCLVKDKTASYVSTIHIHLKGLALCWFEQYRNFYVPQKFLCTSEILRP